MTDVDDKIFKVELDRLEMLSPDGEPTSLYFVKDRETTEDPRIRIALEKAAKYQADAVFFRLFPGETTRSLGLYSYCRTGESP